MRPFIPALTLVFATGLLAGCFPATQVMVPALTGEMVDQAGRPVPGAVVEVYPKPGDRRATRAREFSTQFAAGADGRFARPERVRWLMHMVPGDVYAPVLLVRARSPSGAAASPAQEVSAAPGVALFGLGKTPQKTDLGQLQLQPTFPP